MIERDDAGMPARIHYSAPGPPLPNHYPGEDALRALLGSLPVDRMRQSDAAQRQDWDRHVGDDLDPVIARIINNVEDADVVGDLTVREMLDLIEQAKRDVVCVHCGRRQDGLEIVDP